MKEVTTIGLDLPRNVFQVHGVDGSGDGRAMLLARPHFGVIYAPK